MTSPKSRLNFAPISPCSLQVHVRQHPSTLDPLAAAHANPDETNSAVEVYLQVIPISPDLPRDLIRSRLSVI